MKNYSPAGTLVATPRGQFPIESITARDEVWSYDLIRSCWCPRRILKTYVSDHEGLTATIGVAGTEIEATYLHPFWVVNGEDLEKRPVREHLPLVPDGASTRGRWVDAGDVRVGDDLLLLDGRILPVEVVRCQPYKDKVYNYHIEDFECYAIGQNGVLVHNSNGEQLCGIAGRLHVVTATRIPGVHRVYNMTVEAEHVYRVSTLGVLVHNMCRGQIGGSESLPEFKNFNDAQRAAQDWLETRGFNAAEAEESVSKFTGEVNGMRSGNVGYRIEYDAQNGAHINVFSGKEKGPHLLFPGNENAVNSILGQLFGG